MLISKIKQVLYNLKYGILNIVKWIPVIWKDRQWDKYYLYEILHFKLSLMEKHFYRDKPTIVNSKRYGKQIKIAKVLAKRLANDNYLDNATFWHDQKFEEVDFKSLWRKEPNGMYYSYVGDQNVNRQNSFDKCCKHSVYMRNRDLQYLFDLLNKKIEWWWD